MFLRTETATSGHGFTDEFMCSLHLASGQLELFRQKTSATLTPVHTSANTPSTGTYSAACFVRAYFFCSLRCSAIRRFARLARLIGCTGNQQHSEHG